MAIILSHHAHKTIEAYARSVPSGEIGGMLLGKRRPNGDIVATNAIILDQVKTNNHFEITEESMMEFTKTASEDVLNSVIGWWHSHHKHGTFWSPDDSKCFERLAQLSNMCVGVVVSFKRNKPGMEMRWRVDFVHRDGDYISIDDIQVMIPPTPIKRSKQLMRQLFQMNQEIKDKVVDNNTYFEECSACHGTGYMSTGIPVTHKHRKEKWDDYLG